VNGVYAFGFLFMLPQLFVNYKLKSVAHLPWKAFMYKVFSNTGIILLLILETLLHFLCSDISKFAQTLVLEEGGQLLICTVFSSRSNR
jgi:hypothetical protein